MIRTLDLTQAEWDDLELALATRSRLLARVAQIPLPARWQDEYGITPEQYTALKLDQKVTVDSALEKIRAAVEGA